MFLFRNRNSEIWCYFVASIFKKREIRDRFGALTVFSLQITAKTARRSVFFRRAVDSAGPICSDQTPRAGSRDDRSTRRRDDGARISLESCDHLVEQVALRDREPRRAREFAAAQPPPLRQRRGKLREIAV